MPTYVYQFEDTDAEEQVEVFQKMSDDALAEIDGRPVRRVPCVGAHQISMGELGVKDRYPYVSSALPTTISGCKMVRDRKKNGRLSRHKPLIESRRHEKEVMAKNDLVKT